MRMPFTHVPFLLPRSSIVAPSGSAAARLRYKESNGETSREIVTNAIEDGRSIYDAPADFQFAVARRE